MKHEKTKYFSMFTGVGGFEIGLEQASNSSEKQRTQQGGGKRHLSYNQQKPVPSKQFTCVGFSEIDPYASELLCQKFPKIKNWGDCTKIDPRELPDFDMLCGGFPCQSFSIAGKRRGFEDTRGTMFFEVARILEVKRPKVVFLENVKGLLNHNKGETFSVILQTLDELGYEVQWMVLNSKFFGVPQNRERVFIIGNLRGERRSKILPFREDDKNITFKSKSQTANTITSNYWKGPAASRPLVRDSIIKGESQGMRVYDTNGTSSTLAGNAGGLGGKTGLYAVLTPDRQEKRQNGRRFKKAGEPMFTLTGQDLHGISDGLKIRRLTPKEYERLQSFPDNWTISFSDNQRYKMMGNAVTTKVIQAIAERL